ncbi:MAG: hypothetical protein ABIN69_01800, partial [Aestuariivirga sp.]
GFMARMMTGALRALRWDIELIPTPSAPRGAPSPKPGEGEVQTKMPAFAGISINKLHHPKATSTSVVRFAGDS